MTETLLAAVDLVEAEAASAKRGAYRLALAILLAAVGAALLLCAALALGWGLLTALSSALTPAWARTLVGAALALVAGGVLWIAARTNR
jgi:hypothetical protein